MFEELSEPRCEVSEAEDGRRVRLLGHWTVLTIARSGRDLAAQLSELSAQHPDVWDMNGVEGLDSAGALLLWRAWGERLPDGLCCRSDQRSWLEPFRDLRPAPSRPRLRLLNLLLGLGARIAAFVGETLGILVLLGQLLVAFSQCLRNPRLIPWTETSATIYRAGAQSLLLLGFIGALVGIVFTYQVAPQLAQLGASSQIVGLVGQAFFRELGPFLTALIVVGRSGSSSTAGIGSMQLTEELDALRAFGVWPVLRLVLPRVVGLALVMPLLVVWTNFTGVLGGMYAAQSQLGVAYPVWIEQFADAVPIADYFIGLGKAVLLGTVIGLVAGFYGLKRAHDTQRLTENTTRSVVVGLALIISIDGALGVLFSALGF